MRYKKRLFKVISALLVFVLCLSCVAPLALARASYFIASYDGYMTAGSGGVVTVWFDITGTGMMNEIGSTKIVLYEQNGSTSKVVQTYLPNDYPDMLKYNKNFCGSSVTYKGTPGRSYYALVVFWSGKSGDGDNRSVTTNTVVAKN